MDCLQKHLCVKMQFYLKQFLMLTCFNIITLIWKILLIGQMPAEFHWMWKKTELVIFKHQRKKVDSPVKIKLICKKLYFSKSVKYLGIKINENFNWRQHIHDIAKNLNRANALLSVNRNYVNKHTLRTIYFAIFDSHINCVNLIWAQKARVEL